jgi:hypothetical protein
VNDRTIKLGATLGAVALAFAAPAIASAQDQAASDSMPSTSMPSASYAAPAPMDAYQLDKLQGMGFLNRSSILTAHVDRDMAGNFAPIPSDQLNAALDNVKVIDADGITYTLGEYLHQQDVDPSTIVAVNVTDNAVIVAHT